MSRPSARIRAVQEASAWHLPPFALRQLSKRAGREWKPVSNAELINGDHLRM